MNQAANAAAPPIRAAQINAGQPGDVDNSVNMYRGEVNLPLNLISLPGRNGLDVDVSAFYSSNVHEQVSNWNMDAPTGLLGVGWQLQASKIVMDYGETSSFYDSRLYLVINGQSHELRKKPKTSNPVIYQTKDFNYSQIYYYPDSETWRVINESGITYTFGGGLTRDDDEITGSTDGLCSFGVAWDNWVGSSVQGNGVKMFVKQWNLATIEDTWRAEINYTYLTNNIVIGSGNDYPVYTQSTKIASITGSNQRKVVFYYQEKNSDEKQFPAVPPETGDKNAYQFDYETSFLDYMEVLDEDGALLSKVQLSYELNNVVNSDNNFKKRYLKSVVQYNAHAEPLPATNFEYYTNKNDDNAGALKKIYYPKGAIAEYTYDEITLDNEIAKKSITTPTGYQNTQVWQSTDYVAVSWWNPTSKKIKIKIYSWLGKWKKCIYSHETSSVYANASGEGYDYKIAVGAKFFALTYKHSSGAYKVKLYHRDDYKPNVWSSTKTSDLLSSVSWTDTVQVDVAHDFVVCMDITSANKLTYAIFQWNDLEKIWECPRTENILNSTTSSTPMHFGLAARNNYFAVVYTQPNNSSYLYPAVYYQNEVDEWNKGANDSWQIPIQGTIDWALTDPTRMLTAGSTFMAFSYAKIDASTTTKTTTQFEILGWGSNFLLQGRLRKSGRSVTSAAMLYQAPFSSESMVAVGDKLSRFNGSSWVSNNISDGNQPFFRTYGSDTGLIGLLNGNGDRYEYYGYIYSPYTNMWESSSRSFTDNVLADSGNPTINGNYATVNQKLYYRDSQLEWDALPDELQDEFDPHRVQNFAPSFIAAVEKKEVDDDSRVYFLGNGGLRGVQRFRNLNVIGSYSTLISFVGDDLSTVSEFTLYRFADNYDFNNSMVMRPVTKLTLDTGMRTIVTQYNYTKSKAIYDPYSQVAQFPEVNVHKGDNDGYSGKTKFEYFNGLDSLNSVIDDADDNDPDSNVTDYYGLFAGQLYRKTDYNANQAVVSTLVNSYKAFTDNQMYGAYTRLLQKTETTDGVEKVTQYEYNSKGQLRTETFHNTNSNGEAVLQQTITTYGWENAYTGMRAYNLLDIVVQSKDQSIISGNTTITGIAVTTYTNDPLGTSAGNQWIPDTNYLWTGSGSTIFNFYTPTSNSSWLPTTRNLSCNTNGQPIETADTDDIISTVIYDKEDRLALARFLNADQTEAFYSGFEPYEDLSAWNFANGAVYNTAEVCTGTRSVELVSNGSIRRTIYPNQGNQDFLVGFWLRTAVGYTANQYAQVKCQFGAYSSQNHNLPATNNQWQFQLIKATLDGYVTIPAGTSLEVFFYNDNNTAVYIDNVFVCPALGGFKADVFDPKFYLETAKIGMRGDIRHTIYDKFQRPIINMDQDRHITSAVAKCEHDSHEHSNLSNSETGVNITGDSSYFSFKNSDWQSTWHQNSQNEYTVTDQQLLIENNGSDVLLSLSSSLQQSTFMLRFGLENLPGQSDPGSQFTIQFGDYFLQHFSNQFRLLNGARIEETVFTDNVGYDYLLVVDKQSLFFYQDGQLVLQHITTNDILVDTGSATPFYGTLSIQSSHNLLLSSVGMGYAPVPAMSFKDKNGNVIQEQMFYDNSCQVREIGYDAIGQSIFKTKAMQYPNEGFGYRASLVEVIDPVTHEITEGDIIDFYPLDGGYPYAGKEYEKSPLVRILETGAPGVDFAIRPGNDHTIQMTYGSGGFGNQLPELPDAEYSKVILTNQDGETNAHWTDKAGNVVVEAKGLAYDAINDNVTEITRKFYNLAGQLTKVVYPNAFKNNAYDGLNTTAWTKTMQYDFFGRLTEEQNSDMDAPLKMAYDNSGKIRFQEKPNGITTYIKYDALGRMLEEGTTDSEWSMLEANADNPSFSCNSTSIIRRFEYGTVAGQNWEIGMLKKIYYADNNYVYYDYDIRGNIIGVYDTKTPLNNFRYTYTHDNQIATIHDIKNPDAYLVEYTYNSVGSVETAKMTSNGKVIIVKFEYNLGGGITQRTYCDGELMDIKIDESMSYNSAGWLKSLQSDLFRSTLSYTSGGANGHGYYSGKIAYFRNEYLDGISDTNFMQDYIYQFGYDQYGQLSTADLITDWSAINGDYRSIGNPQYDANGNAKNVYCLGENRANNYYPDTNRLEKKNSGNITQYTYNASGQVLTSPTINNIVWSDVMERPTTIGSLSFDYNHDGNRIKKTISDLTTSYGLGAKGMVLCQSQTVGESTDCVNVKYFLYGPKGLVAISNSTTGSSQKSDPFYFVLKDHEGSIQQVVHLQENGGIETLVAYNYSPFGTTLDTYGDYTICNYRYTGQEYDHETGLYNYRSRIYDPSLGRFYSIDPAMQFSSPYIYAGNDPILFTDFTGDWSQGAKLGIAMGAIEFGIGALITLVGTATNWTGIGIAGAMAGGALMGAGAAGMAYSIAHRNDEEFNWSKYFLMQGIGGVVGGASAGIGAALSGVQTLGIAAQLLITGVVNGAGTAIQDVVSMGIEAYGDDEVDFFTWQNAGQLVLDTTVSVVFSVAGEGVSMAISSVSDDVVKSATRTIAQQARFDAASTFTPYVASLTTQAAVNTGSVSYGLAASAITS